MNLDELKKRREQNFLAHKKKKKEYYLKKKKIIKKEIDYQEELKDDNFSLKIKEKIKTQKNNVDVIKDLIIKKIKEYKDTKKD